MLLQRPPAAMMNRQNGPVHRPRVQCAVVAPDRAASSKYVITPGHKDAFERDGFVHLEGVFSDQELKEFIDPVYFKFLSGDIEVPGKDKVEYGAVLNVMLPRKYYPKWQGSPIEKKAEDIACQLLETDEVDLDFDQIYAKRPQARNSGMPWHQDAAAWPEELNDIDCATANMWLAVTDVPVESGCLRYVPGSHKEGPLRPHQLVGPEDVHMLKAPVGGEKAVLIPMKRGDIVVHSERVVHGSGPNLTDKWRCGYVLNFKRSACVVTERSLGITHSNNDTKQWELFYKKMKN